MPTAPARLAVTRPKAVVAGARLVLLICAGFGATVLGRLGTGGYLPDNAEPVRAQQYLRAHLPGVDPNLVVLVHADRGIDDATARAAARRAEATLRAGRDVSGVVSYRDAPPELAAGLRARAVLTKGGQPPAESSKQKVSGHPGAVHLKG